MKGGNNKAFQDSVVALTHQCAESEVLDSLVLAARADYRVASAVLGDATAKAIFRDTLIRSKDEAIARPAGLIAEEMEDSVVEGVHKALTPGA